MRTRQFLYSLPSKKKMWRCLIFDDKIKTLIDRFRKFFFVFFLSGGLFGFKLVKKMLFLQSFYIRSLLSGVNDNPPFKTSKGHVITKFYCRFNCFIVFTPDIYVHKNSHGRTEFMI